MDAWSLGLAAWVIQDGNYGDFTRGDRAEFAVELYAPDGLTPCAGGTRAATGDGEGWYAVRATVVAVTPAAWVIDCGILVYGERPPEGLSVGDGVEGRVLLSVDHFLYFETLAKEPAMPPLIYSWELLRIRRQTAPYVLDESRKAYLRDESQRGWLELEATDAWEDDEGFAEYVFDCRLLVDVPPKRTSATAT